MSSEKSTKIIVTQPFPGHLKAEERKEDPKSWKRSREREGSGRRSWTEGGLRLQIKVDGDVLLMP